MTVQTELSYNFTHRWEGTLFAGAGQAFSRQILVKDLSFSEASIIASGGVGFRYLLAEKFGLKARIDIATSNCDQQRGRNSLHPNGNSLERVLKAVTPLLLILMFMG